MFYKMCSLSHQAMYTNKHITSSIYYYVMYLDGVDWTGFNAGRIKKSEDHVKIRQVKM